MTRGRKKGISQHDIADTEDMTALVCDVDDSLVLISQHYDRPELVLREAQRARTGTRSLWQRLTARRRKLQDGETND